jgi:iron(III) transport system substrate-binding protein
MRLRILTTALVVLATFLAACQAPPSSGDGAQGGSEKTGYEQVLSQIEGLAGKDREKKLVELAQEEGGALSLYTSLTSDVEDAVADGFGDTYDIDVSVYRTDSETVVARLLEEAEANFEGADVVETNGPELFSLNEEAVLVDYESEYQDDLLKGSLYEGWTADRFNKFVISWNTDKVSAADAPKSWEDLADPQWDGQLAMEPSDVDWYKTLWEYWVNEAGKSEEEANKLFEEMADGASFVKGHTLMGELLSGGEYAVGASNYSYLVEGDIADGAPVAWQPPVEPILSRPNGVALVNQAPHPATAILFVDWILSPAGQELLAEFKLDPALERLATTPTAKEVLVDVPGLVAEQEEWTDRYEQLVTLGKVVEE